MATGPPGALQVTLRRAPVVRGRLVGPDGKPVATAQVVASQEPFAELAHGDFAPSSSAKELEALAGTGALYPYDAVWTAHVDAPHYGDGPKTDAAGQGTFPSLVPGATYRIAKFDGTDRTFTAEAGSVVKLGDVAIKDPAGNKKRH